MNLLYIHTHDSGRVLSPYGYNVPTDNLKEFAKDAITFTNAYCVNPTCSPSRAGLLTGTFPHQNGMLGLAQRGFGLNDMNKHLCRFMKSCGYHTVLSGVQHEVDFYLNWHAADSIGYDEILTHDPMAHPQPELHLWDDENAQEVADWLINHPKDEPFYISYGMHSTHRPFPALDGTVDERYIKPCDPMVNNETTRLDFAQYGTSCHNADLCIGKVLDAVKASGHWDDTIIMFTTDHGVPFPFNKCFLTDKGIGVSLIMHVPNKEKGTVSDALLSQIDIFPTLCDLLGLEKPDYLEGESFASIFDGEEKEDDAVYAEINFHTSYEPARCVRTKRYKYIRYYDTKHLKINPNNADGSMTKNFYLENGFAEYPKYEEAVYDLLYDPEEHNNVIDNPAIRDIVEDLRTKLEAFQEKTDDPIRHGRLPIKPTYKVNKPDCIEAGSKNPDDYEPEGCFYINQNH